MNLRSQTGYAPNVVFRQNSNIPESHVCYRTTLYVVDFECVPNFGEAQRIAPLNEHVISSAEKGTGSFSLLS
jgi:hypothetical protein